MSVDLRREAAALMRSRAEAANDTHGPWESVTHADGRAWIALPGTERAWGMHGYPDHARHIASWHPAVALAVADWLDLCARVWDDEHAAHGVKLAVTQGSDAVARAYLGRDA